MAPVKRHAYEAYFKLQATKYAAENGNRADARHFNGNESMVRKWRKQESERNEQLEGASLLSPFDKRPKRLLKKWTLSTSKERLPADYQERAAIFRTYGRDKITAPSHIYKAAADKLCHHMRVDCRRVGYDTVFMYWKSFHKSRHQR
ncbi:hypothetical protein D4764_20G0008060 [Takifugu flavidus]|uniref:Brinker DNA-binding domain-containing protein n=1 Tax=Takifugu flavidus TaxID=433684 RepID=A0A5C6NH25_9TELE|nr:hypothetical protein D4764_20G0008060 [Takifugu flavidus]